MAKVIQLFQGFKLTVILASDVMEELQRLAEERDISLTEAIRQAICLLSIVHQHERTHKSQGFTLRHDAMFCSCGYTGRRNERVVHGPVR